jgi:putative membrane protein
LPAAVPGRILLFVTVVRGALAGFFGGLLAAGAMSLAHTVIAKAAPASTKEERPKQEDATVKVATAVANSFGRPLAEADKPKAGMLVHYAFGASVGALYGALVELAPALKVGAGLAFGSAVWLGAHVIMVPALGLARPPMQHSPFKEAEEFGLHLLYGLTTELVRRLLRR